MKISAYLLLIIALASPWFINSYKFSQCDFESNYKCELIHFAGVIVPPIAMLTVWFGTDED